ncbi:MAG: hypothetical protein JEZ00_12045 [Anaerolineaceae bacterium]|nr:hypothetical protein [Anaerolineaceae bacterium]
MESADYIAYMLRLWRVMDHSKEIWRASLESPGAGNRYSFSNVDDLLDFLRKEMKSDEQEKDGVD